MKKLKLTELQMHRVHEALRNTNAVLQQIKQKPLEGQALERMKLLEDGAGHLEIFILGERP